MPVPLEGRLNRASPATTMAVGCSLPLRLRMASDPHLPDVPRLLALRFSLRSLLLWMTLLCGLLALLVSVSPGPAIVIASVALLIGAHVVGNALGTRLRDQAPRITDAP